MIPRTLTYPDVSNAGKAAQSVRPMVRILTEMLNGADPRQEPIGDDRYSVPTSATRTGRGQQDRTSAW